MDCPVKTNCCETKDIEEIECCNGSNRPDKQLYVKVKSGEEWVKASSLENVYAAISRFTEAGTKYRIVGGNTGTG